MGVVLGEIARVASRLAREGIPVFPCDAEKRPCVAHGFKAAVRDPQEAYRLFSLHRAALIGVPTGTVSGWSVIDVDPDGMRWFRQNLLRFPETRIHETRRQGLHLIYTHVEGVKNTASKLWRGIDTRGEGGYIIWWPGFGGELIHEADIAPFPSWVLRKLKPKPPKEAGAGGASREGNIVNLARYVARAGIGERNAVTFWGACRAGEMVRRGEISQSEAMSQLIAAATQTGLDQREATTAVRSGLQRGSRETRK